MFHVLSMQAGIWMSRAKRLLKQIYRGLFHSIQRGCVILDGVQGNE